MKHILGRRLHLWPLGCTLILTGCGRAPVFNVWGSFFPAWLACVAAGLLLAFMSHWLLRRLGIEVVFPVVSYPSLAALFTFALWLALFR
jgi:hypothetical protein